MSSFNPATATDTRQQYLTFTLGEALFAVGTLNVREIIEYGHLTPVPLMPPSILGVINLRGGVVPILDLRQRFGQGATQVSRRSCIVILEVQRSGIDQVIGIVVEAVNAVLEIPEQDIEPPPSFGSQIPTDFLIGMGKLDTRLVVLLDIGRVLSLDDLQLLAGRELPESA
ncbi:purine-binding chemotaxis protein CheW [Pseudomonas peli]|jgi:purine-binding chemotaxis protein CheW|uniref:Purine-binding chemotaxis protein CheW n=1 Tax=Pseudomonas peli TaxID=592361 RepID=A0AB37Z6E2_9PSED|nr:MULTISPECIES: chemotaxis protein CheW [Pseudomonas]OHC24514.1 MAG: chemotaxis protein CheW [Pseudomonadales bacterium RIFCSPHIGHO2_02_FULL_60_43]MDR7023843.1 purine-binding chemotaxis protein CheW [Pseudomonas peli]NMZ68161.1 purine-binding chemotaxis protein CheW [Pseudomonas peli]PJE38955.1 MAG: chemotaxis protein CheW [Pseudomonas sp.] [Pseudomonas sp. FEMGT703P]SCW49089.1 purine-binding chemotaxis protein CheW [Pseudomonas peli]